MSIYTLMKIMRFADIFTLFMIFYFHQPQRIRQASRPAMDWGPSMEENRTGMYVNTLAGSQSPKPLMVHMRKYGGITSYENKAIEVDKEIEEESMI